MSERPEHDEDETDPTASDASEPDPESSSASDPPPGQEPGEGKVHDL